MKTDTEQQPSMAELWDLANDMRQAEADGFKTMAEQLAEYKRLRGQLEARLANVEGRPLPDGHVHK